MADFEQDLLDLASVKPKSKNKRSASAMNGNANANGSRVASKSHAGGRKGGGAKKRRVEKSAEKVDSDEEEDVSSRPPQVIDPDATESEPGMSGDDNDNTEGNDEEEEEEDDEDGSLESEDGAPAPQRRRQASIPVIPPSSTSVSVPAAGASNVSATKAEEDADENEDEEEDMDIDIDIESEDGAPAPIAPRPPALDSPSVKPSHPASSLSPIKPAHPSAGRIASTSSALRSPATTSKKTAGGASKSSSGPNATGKKRATKTSGAGGSGGSKKEKQLKERYPLEGRYVDEEDREMIDNLPDLERDQILADRAEEVQKLIDAIALEQLFVARGGEASAPVHVDAGESEEDEEEDVERGTRKGRRSGGIRGSSEDDDDDDADMEIEDDEPEELGRGTRRKSTRDDEKAKEREVLKQARKAKAARTAEKQAKQRRGSPTGRRRSESEGSAAGYGERPIAKTKRYNSDNKAGDYSDSDQGSDGSRSGKHRDDRAGGSSTIIAGGTRKSRTEAERERREDPVRVEDLEGCKLSRHQLAEYKHRDFFTELVVGSYVRGPAPPSADPRGERKNRIYLVIALEDPSPVAYTMEYKLKQIPENRRLRVKYGTFEQKIKMDGISNSAFTQEEFSRWKAMLGNDREPLPLRSELKGRRKAIVGLMTRPITEAEITRRIVAISTLGHASGANGTDTSQAARIRLEAERGLAIRRHDSRALQVVEAELLALDAVAPVASRPEDEEDENDQGGDRARAAYKGEGGAAELQLLARVNERNRRMAVESSRRAHLANLDRRRAMEAGKVQDSSARVKSKMKLHDSTMFNQKAPEANASIDITGTSSHTNENGNAVGSMPASTSAVVFDPTPTPRAVMGKKGSVAVDLDLGDF